MKPPYQVGKNLKEPSKDTHYLDVVVKAL